MRFLRNRRKNVTWPDANEPSEVEPDSGANSHSTAFAPMYSTRSRHAPDTARVIHVTASSIQSKSPLSPPKSTWMSFGPQTWAVTSNPLGFAARTVTVPPASPTHCTTSALQDAASRARKLMSVT